MFTFNDCKKISIKKIKIVVAIILIGVAFRFVEKRNHFFEKMYVSYCAVKNINDKSSSFYDLEALINGAYFYHIWIEDIHHLHIQVIDTSAKIVAKNYDYNYNIDMKFNSVNGVLTDLSKIEMGSNKFETKNHFQSAEIKISSTLSLLEFETLKQQLIKLVNLLRYLNCNRLRGTKNDLWLIYEKEIYDDNFCAHMYYPEAYYHIGNKNILLHSNFNKMEITEISPNLQYIKAR